MQQENIQHNTDCESEDHDNHLCYLISQGFHLSDTKAFKALISEPNFQCQHCSRKANSNKNLCVPVSITNKY